MREVEEAIKANVLRSFTARQAEVVTPEHQHTWRWTKGTILFPEGRCPWCKESIRSNRIWLVKDRMLIKRWKVVDGQVVEDALADHPHVSGHTGGPICTGNARDVLTALFFGMNPGDTYWGRYDPTGGNRLAFHEWLVRVWDHRCVKLASAVPDHDDAIDSHQHCCLAHCTIAAGVGACRVRWYGGVRGCLCGCGCHPRLAGRGCRCGHDDCECPRPPTGEIAVPTPEQKCEACGGVITEGTSYYCENCEESHCETCHYDGGHDGHGEDDELAEYCSQCTTALDAENRSSCCPDWCITCHNAG